MKQLTCRQIGGSCDLAIRTESKGEMAKAASDHIIEKAKTDPAHKKAYQEMAAIYQDKARHEVWQQQFGRMWDEAPVV